MKPKKITNKMKDGKDKCYLLTEKIIKAILQRGWTFKDFTDRMAKQKCVSTRWFSGHHNFTIRTLMEIEKVLDIQLLDVNVALV